MTWVDRLREPAYTSPSGVRFPFMFEDVSRSVDKLTSGHNAAGGTGTYVQDLGHSGYRYPLRVIFSGGDYDLDAKAFEAALLERGAGVLEHPAYGRVDVVPFGTISRRDDLKTAGNQAIIELTFWETTATAYPSSQGDPAAAVEAALEAFNAAAAAEFGDTIDLSGADDKATFGARYRATLDSAQAFMRPLADTLDEASARYDAISDSIDQGLDVLIDEPLTLAFQTFQLIQAPAASAALIADKLDAYRNLASSLINGKGAGGNDFRTSDLYVSGSVTGSVASAVQTQFATKSAALEAAEAILSQFDDAAAWRDESFQTLGQVDTGSAYQALQAAAATAAGFLVQISFNLAQERRIVIDRARTIVDLAAELYGSVDDRLDFLINSNSLTGSEILELPRGATIVYYL